jgi:peptide/nickel transport system substrate-binding protein
MLCIRSGTPALRAVLLAWVVFGCGAADAQTGKPQSGGTLEIGTVHVTLSALSWDPQDWNWKTNHDTGMYYEQLFAADLDKSVRKGGKYRFIWDAWLPSDAIRGELVERWEWKGPLTLVLHLRKGVMFPDKPGVMKSRELTAEDVVFSYERLDKSPKKIATWFDHVAKVEARDRHTVVFTFKEYNAEWDYRFGWGLYSGIVPKEMASVDAKNWKNAVGTGPFQLSDFVQGNSQTYVRNPGYWDKETVGGTAYRIPFVDKLVYRIIKDEATQHTALRTGKLDILEIIRWTAVAQLESSAPQLKWSRWLSTTGQFLAMRVDRKPFDDVRVRRALNMAVDKQEIVKSYYGGNAELFSYPMRPDWPGYYEPLESMPASVKELFVYNPEKAKKLLAEAGYPSGFSFKAQFTTANPDHADLVPLVAGYLEKIGVRMELQPMEYGAFLSAMTTRTHGPGYFMNRGHTTPTAGMRSFVTGQTWNPALWSNPAYDKKMEEVFRTRDEAKRQQMLKQMVVEMLDQAPYLWMPTPYLYTAWWPWVQNYGGELRAGGYRPGPIYARIWIDQEMKKKMGF